jgi:predicted RNase H-like HicB family nuclease
MNAYIALIHKEPDSDFGVSFPDLPGCVTAASTLEEARAFASEALALHLDGLADSSEPVPTASTFEAIMADPENRDALAVLIEAPETADVG